MTVEEGGADREAGKPRHPQRLAVPLHRLRRPLRCLRGPRAAPRRSFFSSILQFTHKLMRGAEQTRSLFLFCGNQVTVAPGQGWLGLVEAQGIAIRRAVALSSKLYM
jgi:hypothetical protein